MLPQRARARMAGGDCQNRPHVVVLLPRHGALFRSALDPKNVDEIRAAVNGGFTLGLGNERFKAEIAAMLGRCVEPGLSGRPSTDNKRAPDARLGL